MFPGPVCAVLTPARAAEVFQAPAGGADCIEVRLDYLDDPAEAAGVRWDRLPAPVIATCRSRSRGGRFGGTREAELAILARAAADGARWVDIDYRDAPLYAGGGTVIASYHDFERTPPDVDARLAAACEAGAAAKLAVTVRSWEDNRRLLELAARPWPRPVIVVGMGAMGEITRILGPSRGSALTYAAVGAGSAPGQLALDELLGTFRFRNIGRRTRLYGIVGNPVGHSRSPALHNRAFAASGLDCVYLRLPVERVDDFFENAGRIPVEGFSVTIPHKIAVIPHLERLTPEAEAAGAVNTVYRTDAGWRGDNTDVHGVRESLKGLELAGARVLVVGTGGAARAAVAALDSSASVTLLSRNRGPAMLDWGRPVAVERLERAPAMTADLLINASPVGMAPGTDRSPVPAPAPAPVVFDMVYNPPVTRLLAEAARAGKRTISGTAMFLAQAARQFEIWTGRPAPRDVFTMEPA